MLAFLIIPWKRWRKRVREAKWAKAAAIRATTTFDAATRDIDDCRPYTVRMDW